MTNILTIFQNAFNLLARNWANIAFRVGSGTRKVGL